MSRRFASVAVSLAGLTLLARILGFGRSLVFSKTVGANCLGDAYNVANALPNVLFEITAGGVLAGVVVPVVARHVGAGRTPAVSQTVSALVTWTLVVLTVPGVLAVVGAAWYGAAYAETGCPTSGATIATLLAMFAPQIWLYGLAVVSAGVLQAHQRFVAAALAPLLSSVVVITAYLAYAGVGGSGLAVLGWGTTAGVLALALTTLVPLARVGIRLRPRLRFAEGDGRVVTGIAAAGALGVAVQQVSVLVINHSAQTSGVAGAVTRFTWANTIYLLPYAVLAAPLLVLAFPRLSTAAERGAAELRAVVAEVTPPLVLMACLGAALLAATAVPMARVFVLGPGNGRTAQLAGPIAAFAPAVVGFALLGLASRTLLAQHRARDAGITTVTGWAVVVVAAVFVDQVVGLAAAVSLGMTVGAVVGWLLVARSDDLALGAALGRPLLVGLVAAGVAVAVAVWPARLAGQVGIVAAVALGLGVALLVTAVFAGVLRLLQPTLFATLVRLRHRVGVSAS